MTRVRMIAAMSADRVIGRKDGLPWALAEEVPRESYVFRRFERIAHDLP